MTLRGDDNTPVILVAGAACVDRILLCPHHPKPDEKLRATRMTEVTGGNAANTAAALALLSSSSFFSSPSVDRGGLPAYRVALLTKVGDDECGARVRADLESKGVDCSSPLFVAAPNSTTSITTVIASESEHTRACLHAPGSCGELTAREVEEAVAASGGDGDDLFRDVIWFHSDSRHGEAALRLAEEARRRGVPISVDVEKDRGDLMEPLVDMASIVFGNEEKLRQYAVNRLHREDCFPKTTFFLSGITGMKCLDCKTWSCDKISSFLSRSGNEMAQWNKCVVVTRGDQGAYHLKRRRSEQFSSESDENTVTGVGTLRNAAVADTTGAGDAFIAGYVAALIAQNSPLDRRTPPGGDASDELADGGTHGTTLFRLRFASWVAGRKLAGLGQEGLPSGVGVDANLGRSHEEVGRRLGEEIADAVHDWRWKNG